jgi:transcriptional regulator with XRE-family HTH domain
MKTRDVKFNESLRALIEANGYSRNRGPICDEVGISNAAISQYLGKRSRPSFEILTRLADFFGVSLDALVYGTPLATSTPPDLGPIIRYVDTAVTKTQERVGQQSALLGRLADRLVTELRESTDKWLLDNTPPLAGLMRDDETLRIERFSKHTRLITFTLHYDVIESASGPAAGRFFDVVVDNLAHNRQYDFLLPGTSDVAWPDLVAEFRTMIGTRIGRDYLPNCRFKVSQQALFFSGVGIYDLDVTQFAASEPILFEQLRSRVSNEGQVGYSIAPSEDLQADALFDLTHLSNAVRVFDSLWRQAKKL